MLKIKYTTKKLEEKFAGSKKSRTFALAIKQQA